MANLMQVPTTRFGTIECTETDVVTMPDGLFGFPLCTRFLILNHRDGSSFRWLQSLDEPDIAFLAIDPTEFNLGYEPELPDYVAESLELEEETPRLVFALVSIPPGSPADMTANLAGPVVINAENRLAAQVVVEDSKWTTRHRILDEMRAVVAIPEDAA